MSSVYTPEFLIAFAAGLLVTGTIAGVLAGLLGVGGGIVIVPVLFWLAGFLGLSPDIAMPMAVGTSLDNHSNVDIVGPITPQTGWSGY